MVTVSLGIPSHDVLPGVSAADHHTATVAGDLNHQDLANRGVNDHHAQSHNLASHSTEAHAELSAVGTDDHHAQAHVPESHTGQGATAAELETLTGASSAQALHNHPLLVGVAATQSFGDNEINGITNVQTGTAKGLGKASSTNTQAITTAKTIHTNNAGNNCSFVVVFGENQTSSDNSFMDIVFASDNGDAAFAVISQSLIGSPAARTYAMSGQSLTLAMAANTYDVSVYAIDLVFPN